MITPFCRISGALVASSILAALVACNSGNHTGPNSVASVAVSPSTATVAVGDTVALVAQAKDPGGNVISGRAFTFASSDTTKAAVNAAGVVTAVAAGSARISATTSGVSGQAQMTLVTVQDNWTTYGHDGHRTAASRASIKGPLKLAWSYTPVGTAKNSLLSTEYPLATTKVVVVREGLSINFGFGITPSAEGVSPAGAHLWTYAMGSDADFGDWASIYNNKLVINDDGIRYVDLNTGKSVHGGGVDYWGESLADSVAGLFLVNDVQIDGPGVFVSAYDTAGKSKWTQNSYRKCRGSASAMAGGLALNNGILFFAPAYSTGADTIHLPFGSGVYAFNASTGAPVTFKSTTPFSRLSADGANVYLVEKTSLVARAQSDLHVVWSVSVTNPGEQAPVLANGLVLIATDADVEAYSAQSGHKAWTSAALSGAAAHWSNTSQGSTCGYVTIPESQGPTATMAAALASRTLVVTAFDGVHVLSLADGHDVWHGPVAGSSGLGNPIIVNDPATGAIVYVTDFAKLYALIP